MTCLSKTYRNRYQDYGLLYDKHEHAYRHKTPHKCDEPTSEQKQVFTSASMCLQRLELPPSSVDIRPFCEISFAIPTVSLWKSCSSIAPKYDKEFSHVPITKASEQGNLLLSTLGVIVITTGLKSSSRGIISPWLRVLLTSFYFLHIVASIPGPGLAEYTLDSKNAGEPAFYDNERHRSKSNSSVVNVSIVHWTVSPIIFGIVIAAGLLSEHRNSFVWRAIPSTVRSNLDDFWTIIAFVSAAALGPLYSQPVFEGPANALVIACLVNQYRACFRQVVTVQTGLPLSVLSWLTAQHFFTKLVPEDEKGLRRVVIWLTACVSIVGVSKLCAFVQGFRGTVAGRIYHNVHVLGAHAVVGDYIHVERSLV